MNIKENIKEILQNPLVIKYKFYIVPVFSILISLTLLVIFIIPGISSGFDTQNQVNDINSKVVQLTKKSSDLEKIDDNVYKENLQTTLVAIPQEKDASGAIGQVLYFMRNNQLTVNSVSFGSTLTEDNIQTFQIRIDVNGDVADIKRFIADIKRSPRLLKISGIEITGNRRSTKIQATLAISTYFQPLPAAIGKVDQPLVPPTPKDLELLKTLKENLNSIPVTSSENITGPHGKTDPFQ